MKLKKKYKKILIIVAIILLIALITIGIIGLTKKHKEKVEAQKEEEKIKTAEYEMLVKINPLVKIKFEINYELCLNEETDEEYRCNISEEKVTDLVLLNDDAKNIYKDLSFKDQNLYKLLAELCDTAKENNITVTNLKLITNYDNLKEDVKDTILFNRKYQEDFELVLETNDLKDQETIISNLEQEVQKEKETKKQNPQTTKEDKVPIIRIGGNSDIAEVVKSLPITFIGDSVMVGAAQNYGINLKTVFPNCIADAAVSRAVSTGASLVKTYKSQGRLGNPVVIGLGTNGGCTSCIQSIIDTAGKDRDIFLITTTNKEDVNNTYRDFANKNSNVYLIDWATLSKGHAGYFYGDGIHLTPGNNGGRVAYINVIYNAIYNVYATKYGSKIAEKKAEAEETAKETLEAEKKVEKEEQTKKTEEKKEEPKQEEKKEEETPKEEPKQEEEKKEEETPKEEPKEEKEESKEEPTESEEQEEKDNS